MTEVVLSSPNNGKVFNPTTRRWLSIHSEKGQAFLHELEEENKFFILPGQTPRLPEDLPILPMSSMPRLEQATPTPVTVDEIMDMFPENNNNKNPRKPSPLKKKIVIDIDSKAPSNPKSRRKSEIQLKQEPQAAVAMNSNTWTYAAESCVKSKPDYTLVPQYNPTTRQIQPLQLGSGAYGSVYVVCRKSNCDYVIKIQPIDKSGPLRWQALQELSIHKYLSKTGKRIGMDLVPLFVDSWECSTSSSSSKPQHRQFQLVVSQKYSGSLNQLLHKQRQHISWIPKQVQPLIKLQVFTWTQFKDLVSMISEVNKAGVVHGDLHFDNILYRETSTISSGVYHHFVLNDFGFSFRTRTKNETIQNLQDKSKYRMHFFNSYLPCGLAKGLSPIQFWEIHHWLNWLQLEAALTANQLPDQLYRLTLINMGGLGKICGTPCIFMGFLPNLLEQMEQHLSNKKKNLYPCRQIRYQYQHFILTKVFHPPLRVGDQRHFSFWDLNSHELVTVNCTVRKKPKSNLLYVF